MNDPVISTVPFDANDADSERDCALEVATSTAEYATVPAKMMRTTSTIVLTQRSARARR